MVGRAAHGTFNNPIGLNAVSSTSNSGGVANRLNQSFNQTAEQHSSLLNNTINLAEKINKNKFLTNSDHKKI